MAKKSARNALIEGGLERRSSPATRDAINKILESINRLSAVDKLQLYLKLPTHSPPVSEPIEAQKSTIANQVAVNWIKTHLEENAGTSLLKQKIYDEYRSFCQSQMLLYTTTAEFGRLLRLVFPNIKPRRLGKRGNARYMYGGIGYLIKPAHCEIPVIDVPSLNSGLRNGDASNSNGTDEETDDDDEDVEGMVRDSAVSVVLEWACKLLDCSFTDVRCLARHLVVNNYVNNLSANAFTVLSAVSEDDVLDGRVLVARTATTSAGDDAPLCDEATLRRKETKTNLLKTIQRRSALQTQKSRMEEGRTQVIENGAIQQAMHVQSVASAREKTSTTSQKTALESRPPARKVAYLTQAPKLILPKLYTSSAPAAVQLSTVSPSASIASLMDQHCATATVNSCSAIPAAAGTAQLVILSPTPGHSGGAKSVVFISSPITNHRGTSLASICPQSCVDTKYVLATAVNSTSTVQSIIMSSPRVATISTRSLAASDTGFREKITSSKAQNLQAIFCAQGTASTTALDVSSMETATPVRQATSSNNLSKVYNKTIIDFLKTEHNAVSDENSSKVDCLSFSQTPPIANNSIVPNGSDFKIVRTWNTDESIDGVDDEPNDALATSSNALDSGSFLTGTTLLQNATIATKVFEDNNENFFDIVLNNSTDEYFISEHPKQKLSMPVDLSGDSVGAEVSIAGITTSPMTSPDHGGGPTTGTHQIRARSSSSASKLRSPNKTVSSLLREVHGNSLTDGKKFHNDSRPVAQLLRESRESKYQQGSQPGCATTANLFALNSTTNVTVKNLGEWIQQHQQQHQKQQPGPSIDLSQMVFQQSRQQPQTVLQSAFPQMQVCRIPSHSISSRLSQELPLLAPLPSTSTGTAMANILRFNSVQQVVTNPTVGTNNILKIEPIVHTSVTANSPIIIQPQRINTVIANTNMQTSFAFSPALQNAIGSSHATGFVATSPMAMLPMRQFPPSNKHLASLLATNDAKPRMAALHMPIPGGNNQLERLLQRPNLIQALSNIQRDASPSNTQPISMGTILFNNLRRSNTQTASTATSARQTMTRIHPMLLQKLYTASTSSLAASSSTAGLSSTASSAGSLSVESMLTAGLMTGNSRLIRLLNSKDISAVVHRNIVSSQPCFTSSGTMTDCAAAGLFGVGNAFRKRNLSEASILAGNHAAEWGNNDVGAPAVKLAKLLQKSEEFVQADFQCDNIRRSQSPYCDLEMLVEKHIGCDDVARNNQEEFQSISEDVVGNSGFVRRHDRSRTDPLINHTPTPYMNSHVGNFTLQQLLESKAPISLLQQQLQRKLPQQQQQAAGNTSRPVSALAETQMDSYYKPTTQASRPSTVAAFSFDEPMGNIQPSFSSVPANVGTNKTPTSSVEGDSQGSSNRSTPISSRLMSPQSQGSSNGSFIPVRLYDAIPTAGNTLKPMAKVANNQPAGNRIGDVMPYADVAMSSSGNFVPSQTSCFSRLSAHLGTFNNRLMQQNSSSGSQLLDTSVQGYLISNSVPHETNLVFDEQQNSTDCLQMLPGSEVDSINILVNDASNGNNGLFEEPAQGFAPASSIPLPVRKGGRVKSGNRGGTTGVRHRHHSAQEFSSDTILSSLIQILQSDEEESAANMIRNTSVQPQQQQLPSFLASSNSTTVDNILDPSSLRFEQCASPTSPEVEKINRVTRTTNSNESALHRSLSAPLTYGMLISDWQQGSNISFMDRDDQTEMEGDQQYDTAMWNDNNQSTNRPSFVKQQYNHNENNTGLPVWGVGNGGTTVARGDHMISGATLLQPAASHCALRGINNSSSFAIGNVQACTPPSSQNSSPEFAAELAVLLDKKQPVCTASDEQSTSVLDTPNSFDAGSANNDFDSLFSMCNDASEWG